MADDLGYADLSCFGRRDYETPHIDSLARDGVKLTQAYANSPVCSATRTALITGRYQYRFPIGLEEPLVNRDVGLEPEVETLPRVLQRAGYSTALVGKWHLGALPDYGPLKSGYDQFWGFRSGSVDYFSHNTIGGHDLWDGTQEVHETGYLTQMLGDRAVDVIEDASKSHQPFFLSLHFSAPHWPWEGPNDLDESKRIQSSGLPIWIVHLDGGSIAVYAEMMKAMDRQVGRILDTLDRLNISDNTIVVFTSDNGGERFSDTWPFTGRKTELLEGGIRVPTIVRWPAELPAGAESEQVCMSMDWLPTLVAAAGAPMTPGLESDGMDLLPSLRGGKPQERTLFWRYRNLSQRACRSGNLKYLKILENEFLFDVVEDPLERANLKDRQPDAFETLKADYAAWEATMLPEDPEAFTHGANGADFADRFGVGD
ncbi:N-acetylgalactosamine-6-sulfatase [Hyphomonas adhaerens MHS-3]|uniref:N-acetylgalactosamine-6-sulfatase n=2 Tax=Hyphomonas adhaerens TaxID=81029 RepID=A0A069E6V7_9PROT|nr:N-acetylgalactosamine-6-sulfatase [Hyphomonas adhaerens MHS-3]